MIALTIEACSQLVITVCEKKKAVFNAHSVSAKSDILVGLFCNELKHQNLAFMKQRWCCMHICLAVFLVLCLILALLNGQNIESRDVPVNHPVLGICRVSHYPVLSGPGKIIDPSNFFLQSKILKWDGVGYQSRTQLVTTVFNRSRNPFKSILRVG